MMQPVIDVRDMRVGINGISMLSPLTGIGQYTFNLVRALQALQLSPWMFYGADWRQEVRTQPLPGIGAIKGVIKRVVPRPYVVSRYLMQRRFTQGAHANRIALYHEPNFMAYRFNGPAVVTVHDLSWIHYAETQPAARVRELERLMPRTMQTAAHVLVNSEFIRQEVIAHYGITEDRISTVLLGVSGEFQPRSEAQCASVLQSYGLQYGRYLLAVATLEPRKNLDTLIAAYAQLPDALRQQYPLVIAGMRGWGDSLVSPKLKQMLTRNEVRLTGYVPQQDLPLLYAGARAFVYPSLYEGFGLPPLEAMACAVPVIVSNRASLPEVVGDAGILVEAMDDADIARQMRSVIEDDGLHARLAQQGLQRAQTFSWNQCAVETLAVYQAALQKI